MLKFAYKRAIIRQFNTHGKLYFRNQVLRMYNFPFASYCLMMALLSASRNMSINKIQLIVCRLFLLTILSYFCVFTDYQIYVLQSVKRNMLKKTHYALNFTSAATICHNVKHEGILSWIEGMTTQRLVPICRKTYL